MGEAKHGFLVCSLELKIGIIEQCVVLSRDQPHCDIRLAPRNRVDQMTLSLNLAAIFPLSRDKDLSNPSFPGQIRLHLVRDTHAPG
jgi:hypothetical protein